jgi:hypothetical protein
MNVRRRLRLLAVGLDSTLALGACGLLPGGDDEPAGTAPRPPRSTSRSSWPGCAPNLVVIQTDRYPEAEYGATYNLVGDGYRVDAKNKKVRGPMVVEGQGKATGVDVEVRSGGPAIDFARISDQMYTDRDITLGYVNTEQAAQLYAKTPTLSVAAPMDISPGAIMWSPEQHPGWNTMVDIGQADGAKVLVTADDLLRERLGWRFQPATAGVTVVTAAAQPLPTLASATDSLAAVAAGALAKPEDLAAGMLGLADPTVRPVPLNAATPSPKPGGANPGSPTPSSPSGSESAAEPSSAKPRPSRSGASSAAWPNAGA